jgi:glycosyltransferase involved in cell wall biosynthesis
MIGLDKNSGLAAARNAGILNSSYDLVFPLDADDKIQPIALEKLVNALIENNADCAFADFQLFGSENGFWTFSGVTEGPEILKSQPIPGAGTLMTKSLWQKTGGYCEANEFRKGNEDWDFWLSAAHFKVIAAHIKEPLYLYRRYPNSMSLTLNADDYYVRRFMISRHRELFKKTGGARKFLADGCYNAASYYFSKGRIEGIIPLLRGLIISPNIRKSARSIRSIVRYFKKNENANE